MTAVLRAQGLGKKYRRQWALTDCTLDVPAGQRRRPGRPQRRRQDHPAEPRRRPAARRPPARSRCSAAPAGGPGAAGQGRLRRAGHPDLRRAQRRRPPAARRPPQPALGRRAGRRPDRAARPGSRAAGRQALRRPARPARPHPGHRQAARAADPRRAGGQPRPARPTRVPAGPDGGGRRARAQRRAVLAPGLRPRAGLRLPHRAGRLTGPGRRRHRRRCWPPTTGSPAPRRDPDDPPGRPARDLGQPHRPADHACWSAPSAPILDPAWTVAALSLEDLVLAYMSGSTTVDRDRPRRSGGAPMIWLTWRQFRVQAIVVYAALCRLLAVALALTGGQPGRRLPRQRGRLPRPDRLRPLRPDAVHRRRRGGVRRTRRDRRLLGRPDGRP